MKCYLISLGIGLNMFFTEYKKMVCGEEVETHKNWSGGDFAYKTYAIKKRGDK
ncbi:hypothetical protein OQZ33_04410 [Pedobacter sp. MC2016-05]|uniref:hypothetical protein n=1 Tax=Pedobacter sp. MC2016-05 TaxID=2994474 RepID=UPI0022480DE9|nr:hypothetical protein [Pedobacter sp. MC2016-05]MCX2473569.1 hypothetical protein [Pedobacter sp. MC2016-05]